MKLLNLLAVRRKEAEAPEISERPQRFQYVPLYAISSGRSMVEMLGVLAIVGVLSVGAIAGYQKAMEKYRWNMFVRDVNTLIFNTKAAIGTKYVEKENFSFLLENMKDLPGGFYRGEHSAGILEYTPNLGFAYAVLWVLSGSSIQLEFRNSSTEFCRKVFQTNWTDLDWNYRWGGGMGVLHSGVVNNFNQPPTIDEIDIACPISDKSRNSQVSLRY